MKNTKLTITHENNKIYFTNPEANKLGFTDYSDELWEIVSALTWRIKGKYIYSGNKSLHWTVMEYWCGHEYCSKMKESGFVIDHIDNDGFNCLYENLAFLTHSKNWHYKGGYYDKERVKNIPIAAVNIFKHKSGKQFQITVGFNIPFANAQGQEISKAFFVYDTSDYKLILSDALYIVESAEEKVINVDHLRFDRMKIHPLHTRKVKGAPPKTGSIFLEDGKVFVVLGSDFPVIQKIAPDNTLW